MGTMTKRQQLPPLWHWLRLFRSSLSFLRCSCWCGQSNVNGELFLFQHTTVRGLLLFDYWITRGFFGNPNSTNISTSSNVIKNHLRYFIQEIFQPLIAGSLGEPHSPPSSSEGSCHSLARRLRNRRLQLRRKCHVTWSSAHGATTVTYPLSLSSLSSTNSYPE